MTAFDLLLRGGTVVDGTGAPARRADVGVLGDRILAVGDLGALDEAGVERILDVDGRVVAPGFIDTQGQSGRTLSSGGTRSVAIRSSVSSAVRAAIGFFPAMASYSVSASAHRSAA